MSTGAPVLQSGSVTPAHLTQWATDGVIEDAGVEYANTLALYRADVVGVNFNAANTDTEIPINLPAGFTRWRIHLVLVSGASGSLSSATAGLFTAASGGGVAIVSNISMTITTNAANTNNNMQAMTLNNQNTQCYNATVVYFRTGTAEGVAATANVSVLYEPLP